MKIPKEGGCILVVSRILQLSAVINSPVESWPVGGIISRIER